MWHRPDKPQLRRRFQTKTQSSFMLPIPTMKARTYVNATWAYSILSGELTIQI